MVVIFTLYILVVAGFILDAVMHGENPYQTLCRIAGIVALPILGMVLYVLDGRRSHTRHKAPSRVQYQGVAQLVRNACGEPVTMHNAVTLLNNADVTYAAIIGALQRARSTILLEYYIFADDRVGRVLCDILERKARTGVRVCVIYDAIGSWGIGRRTLSHLRKAGVEVRPYKPLRFPWIRGGIARRNHRKIAIIDSQVAFTGGINIAKRYIDGNNLGRWRDEHLRLEGDIVDRLQRLFMRDWSACGDDTASLQIRHKNHSVTECSPVQIAWNDENESRQTIFDLIVASIARANHVIRISTPYFVPPQGVFDALRIALSEGVKVELMVPEHGDSLLTSQVSESYLRRIELCGAKIYRYEKGFLHSKAMIIDDNMASVGTANIDYRSLCENLEVTCLLYDHQVVAHLCKEFENDKTECRNTGSDKKHSPTRASLAEAFARLLSPLL